MQGRLKRVKRQRPPYFLKAPQRKSSLYLIFPKKKKKVKGSENERRQTCVNERVKGL